MSYAQRKEMSSNRTVAIVIVALIHLILGYAIVTGLAFNVIKKAAEDLKTFDVEEEQPPPEEPPPPPEQVDIPPPPMTPPPLVRLDTPPPPIVLEQREITAPPPVIAPAPPPPPPPPRVVQTAKARGSLQGLIQPDDYPESALEAGIGGTVRVRLEISAQGRVTGCSVQKSAGNSSLDRATCSVLSRRARFTPAVGSDGGPTHDSYVATITWQVVDQ
jgi:protein TonB